MKTPDGKTVSAKSTGVDSKGLHYFTPSDRQRLEFKASGKVALLYFSKGQFINYKPVIDVLLESNIQCFISSGGRFRDYYEYIRHLALYEKEACSEELDYWVQDFMKGGSEEHKYFTVFDEATLSLMLTQLGDGKEYGFNTFDEVLAHKDACLAQNLPVGIRSSCFVDDSWTSLSYREKKKIVDSLCGWQSENDVDLIFNADNKVAESIVDLLQLQDLFRSSKVYFYRYEYSSDTAYAYWAESHSLFVHHFVVAGTVESLNNIYINN